MDLGTSGYFFTKDASKKNMDPTSPLIWVGTASGQPMTTSGICELVLHPLPSYFSTTGHAMPGFQDNLVGVGPMCNANCTVTFSNHVVNIYSPNGTPIITNWREPNGLRLWCMSILTNAYDMYPLSLDPESQRTSLQDFSAYELPSGEALVRYFHADAGFPVCNT